MTDEESRSNQTISSLNRAIKHCLPVQQYLFTSHGMLKDKSNERLSCLYLNFVCGGQKREMESECKN